MRKRSSPEKDRPDFKSRKLTPDERITETPDALQPEPGPSCVSLKSDRSKYFITNFKGRKSAAAEEADEESLQHQSDLDSIFKMLEGNIIMFVKDELKKMQNDLNPDYSECQRDEEEVLDSEEEKQRRSSRECGADTWSPAVVVIMGYRASKIASQGDDAFMQKFATGSARYKKVIKENQDHMDAFKAINIFREHMMAQKAFYKAL
ncbi:uncharacterized protein LOC102200938 [Pundamilia nyererei]|uniref:Uncharacterized protein LOC102200938 n=1 Tax=Pundamilia nyererei TaxID=303518 RepID=A0A9Y3VVL1_9CICH|nr:PREDICTED: uncharacterized protein LOC102200938 [Pundamilia nyererei]